MTNEEAIDILEDYDINFERNTAEAVAEAHEMAIKALKTQPSEDEKVIRIKKGTLKGRTGRFAIYDVDWLRHNFNTTEAKIYGQPKAEGARGDIPLQQSVPKMPQSSKHTEERTETHECDLEQIIKTTIKEYLDKDYDDVTELLLALNKDLCERIRKEK